MRFIDVKAIPLDLKNDQQFGDYADAYFRKRAEWENATPADIPRLLQKTPTLPVEQYTPIKKLFLSGTELLAQTVQVKRLIGRLIRRECFGQIFGPSGDGKSFVAADMGLTVATGQTWNGIQCKQGLVVMFVGEGHEGASRRVKAWHKSHGEPDISFFHISGTTITFDEKGLRAAVAEIHEVEKQAGQQVALIIVDTLARHLIGDENTSKDMGAFVDMVASVMHAFPESSAIVVHHTGKDADKTGQARGSSALKGACDFEIQCMNGLLTFTKLKDDLPPAPIPFKLTVHQLGFDEEAEPITSCSVQYGERSLKSVALSDPQQAAIEVLITVSSGPVGTADSQNKWGSLVGDWRSAFYAKQLEAKPDLKRKTLETQFDRAANSLIEKGLVLKAGNSRMLISDEHQQQITTLRMMPE